MSNYTRKEHDEFLQRVKENPQHYDFVGIGSLVTPCHGFTSRIGTVIDGDISFYCNICDKRILREDFITIEEYTNKVRFDKLKDILNE